MNDLPLGWRNVRIKKLLRRERREIETHAEELYHEVGIRSHGLGIFHKEPVTGAEIGKKRIYWIEPGDFVLNIVFAWEGAVALASEDEKGMCGSHRFPTYRVNRSMCDPEYLLNYFKTAHGIHQLLLVSPGGAGRNKTLNQTDFSNLLIPLPPLLEQHKIAKILSTWDEAITLIEQIIDALEKRHESLVERLVSGKVRLPHFKEEWVQVKVGRFLNESRLEGTNGAVANKLSVKLHGKGVYQKHEIAAGSSATNYYTRKAGQFIYSKLDFLNGAFGIIPEHLDGFESTVDLPAFDVNCTVVNPIFFLNLVKRPNFYKRYVGYTSGTRKARRLHPKEFFKFTIELPSIDEQNSIVEVIETSETSLSLWTNYRDTLKQQKKGLMQRLLTGEVRVRT